MPHWGTDRAIAPSEVLTDSADDSTGVRESAVMKRQLIMRAFCRYRFHGDDSMSGSGDIGALSLGSIQTANVDTVTP